MKAVKTLAAIEAAMIKDEGARFRQLQAETLPACKDAYDTNNDPFRNHLGASVIGRKCVRALWYAFRWVARETPKPNMMRLWNRGHLEEGRMIALLRMIETVVRQHDDTGKQIRISDHWGYFGGSSDGWAYGVPDLPGQWVLTEYKTHNEKSYTKLIEEGLIKAKYEHFVQMQIYMHKMGLASGLYMAVNKNTDHIHAEIVLPQPDVAIRHLERAAEVITSPVPLRKLSENSSWHECKWCEFRAVCHLGAKPLVNCRTCVNVRMIGDGKWGCALAGNQQIPKHVQFTGCQAHNYNPNIWPSN